MVAWGRAGVAVVAEVADMVVAAVWSCAHIQDVKEGSFDQDTA